MKEKLVSIIIPIYNVELYINRCIHSIIGQYYDNIEVILIDDGSSDLSGKYADKWKNKDNRIIVVHQENQGVSAARNCGLKIAKGELICFVDADDYIENDYVGKLVRLLEEADCAILSAYNYESEEEHTFQAKEILEKILDDNSVGAYPWNKIFRKAIIEQYQIEFPLEIKKGEDGIFSIRYLMHCGKVNYCQCRLNDYYHYVYRSDNATCKREYRIDTGYYQVLCMIEKEAAEFFSEDGKKHLFQLKGQTALHAILCYWIEKKEYNEDVYRENMDITGHYFTNLFVADKILYCILKICPRFFYRIYVRLLEKYFRKKMHQLIFRNKNQ